MKKIDEFIEWLDLNYERRATRVIYLKNINDFFKNNDIFDQETINNYLTNKEVSNATFNLLRVSLQIYQKFLVNHTKEKIHIDYPRPRATEEADPKYITEEQLDDIVKKLPLVFLEYDKARVVLMLAFYTGMRPNEIVCLKRNVINLDKCVIDLKKHMTKTHRARKIPFPIEIKKNIVDYFNRTEEIDNAFNINSDYLKNTCRKVKKYFDLEAFSPYVLRHSFAKWCLNITNIHYDTVKRLMGHANITTTHTYTKTSTEEAINIYNKVANKKGRKRK